MSLTVKDKNGRATVSNAGSLVVQPCMPDCKDVYLGPWSGFIPSATWGSFDTRARLSRLKLGGVKHCFPNNVQYRAASPRPYLGPKTSAFKTPIKSASASTQRGNSTSVSMRTFGFGGKFSGVSCQLPTCSIDGALMTVPTTQCTGPRVSPWQSLLPQQWSWGFEIEVYDKVSGLSCRKQLTCPFAWGPMAAFGVVKKCW